MRTGRFSWVLTTADEIASVRWGAPATIFPGIVSRRDALVSCYLAIADSDFLGYSDEQASTLLTSNRPVEDWGKLLADSAAVTAMLDRLLHHGHVLKCGPRSWRTKTDLPPQQAAE